MTASSPPAVTAGGRLEACDDGNNVPTDACLNDCSAPAWVMVCWQGLRPAMTATPTTETAARQAARLKGSEGAPHSCAAIPAARLGVESGEAWIDHDGAGGDPAIRVFVIEHRGRRMARPSQEPSRGRRPQRRRRAFFSPTMGRRWLLRGSTNLGRA